MRKIHPDYSLYPWTRRLDALTAFSVPQVQGDRLLIATDFAGGPGSRFHVIGILLADWDFSDDWLEARMEVRNRFLPNNRRMSFKYMNDCYRRKALSPFLQAAKELRGLLATIIIDTRIKALFADKKALEHRVKDNVLRSKWKLPDFENMIRVAFFVSYFLSWLGRPEQEILWVTDQDQVVANERREEDILHLSSRFLTFLAEDPHFSVDFSTTAVDSDDRGEEDIAAIPDLVVGAICETLHLSQSVPCWPYYWQTPEGITPKTKTVLEWVCGPDKKLNELTILFAPNSDSGFTIRKLAMT